MLTKDSILCFVGNDITLDELVAATDGYSGAEICAVCKEAAMFALKESFDAEIVNSKHFSNALKMVRPRLDSNTLKFYDEYSAVI